MRRTTIGSLLLAALLVVGTAAPAVAATASPGRSAADGPAATTATLAAQTAQNASQNGSSVNVTVGQQLSTVISVSSDEVQTDFENTAFELAVETESAEERAEAIADRAEELRERAETIREEYRAATDAFEDGDIDRSTYAERLATLNARARNLLASHEQLQSRAANVSALELRAAGVNRTALADAVEAVDAVDGTGPAALLRQFTGAARGEIELETADGLSIEVESEDGERSREFERTRDTDRSITVAQADALETAREGLSTPANGTWVLVESTVKRYDGAYEFEFALRNAPGQTGEAEVRVDGSSGAVYRLEEEIEARDDEAERDEDGEERAGDDEREDEDRELGLVVSDGVPARGETVTLRVFDGGAPTAGVTVYLNDRAVGTSDADGAVRVTLPAAGEAELTARQGDAEGELEFEFDDEREDDDLFRDLRVETRLDGDGATTTVTYDGSGVGNASVSANGRVVGTTDADGTVRFPLDPNATEDLELSVVKGEFEAELTYSVRDGALVPTQSAHRGDDPEDEREEDDLEAEREEDERDDEDDADEYDADEDETESEFEDDEETVEDEAEDAEDDREDERDDDDEADGDAEDADDEDDGDAEDADDDGDDLDTETETESEADEEA